MWPCYLFSIHSLFQSIHQASFTTICDFAICSLSTETLEKALLETDHNGVLTDILLMMMSAIFTLQEEEEAEEEELSKEDKANQGKIINKKGLTGLIKVKPGVTLGNNMEIKMFFKNENRLNTIKDWWYTIQKCGLFSVTKIIKSSELKKLW